MTKEQMLQMQMMIKRKLLAATAMLLVSAMMLSTSTYAWVVLSIAPEVSSVKTTAGSNGNLEIALLGTDITDTGTYIMAHPTGGGTEQSSALTSVSNVEANEYYGNIVDLATNYGLESIMLTPARLNLITSGSSVLVNTQYPLKVPQYGTDGRINAMAEAPKAHYDSEADLFEDTTHWGVNVIGFKSDLNSTDSQTVVREVSRDSIRAEAAEYIYHYKQQIREDMIDRLEELSDEIFGVINKTTGILLPFPFNQYIDENGLQKTFAWDNKDIQCIRNISNMLSQVAVDSDIALRWAFLGYCVSDNVHFNAASNEDMAELGRIYKQFLTMPLIPSDTDTSNFNIRSIAAGNGYETLVTAIDAIQQVKTRVAAANVYLDAGQPGNAGACIISVTGSYIMNGESGPNSVYVLDGNGYIYTGASTGYYRNIIDGRTEDKFFFVGANSVADDGLFQAMARVVGDYTATLQSTFKFSALIANTDKTYTYDLMVTSKNTGDIGQYNETENTGALGMIYKGVSELKTTGTIPLEINRFGVNAYGYQIDLALRSSEAGSLVLEREGLDRVTGMTKEEAEEMGRTNVELQGNGSTFSFTLPIDMIDEDNERINAILKCVHIIFMTIDGQIYAVGVPSNPTVKGDIVTGPIRLYNVNQSETVSKGTLTLGSEITSNAITTLQQDKEVDISVIVYLDGDKVTSAYTSASKGFSLDGSLNLQFGNTTELKPMNYSDYLPVDSID